MYFCKRLHRLGKACAFSCLLWSVMAVGPPFFWELPVFLWLLRTVSDSYLNSNDCCVSFTRVNGKSSRCFCALSYEIP